MPAISLRHIEIFHAVMTTGNLTEAAALLQTSQPTVSRELARCEKLFNLQLFERVRGRLHPTAQGLRLFEEVQRSYYGLDRIINAAAGIRQFEQAQLSIVCLPVFSQSLLPAVCQPFYSIIPRPVSTLCRRNHRCWRSGFRRSAMIWASRKTSTRRPERTGKPC